MGRKITLKPIWIKAGSDDIKGFDDLTSYFEEGHFNNDQLDCTFGRRIYGDGNTKLGWFQGSGYKLHGFGKSM